MLLLGFPFLEFVDGTLVANPSKYPSWPTKEAQRQARILTFKADKLVIFLASHLCTAIYEQSQLF